MGATIINMGVIGGFVGYYSYHGIKSVIKNKFIPAAIAAWLGCFIAAVVCAIEMFIAGTFPLVPGIIAMGTYHAAIGIIEGVITAGAIYLIYTTRPDLIELDKGDAQ